MTLTDLPGNLGGGNPLTTWLNRVKRAVARRTLLPGIGYKVRQTEGGTVMEILPGAGGASPASASVEMFVLKSCGTSDDADLLVCRTWDGESEGVTDVYIYKPFKLRNISIRIVGGNTITYTWDATYLQRTAFLNAGAGSIAEAQTIVPRYITPYTGYAGDVIHAGKLKYAQTVNQRTIEYVDLNVDGRAWAKSYA